MSKKVKSTTALPLALIDWRFPEGSFTPYATNMLVQRIENEFKVSFFEIKPPVRFSESEAVPEKVRADCVASVIISADRLPNFIKALQTQFDGYQQEKKLV
jgi:hypothetical protein